MILSCTLIGLLCAAPSAPLALDSIDYMAELDGAQVVPPNSSLGSATIYLSFGIDEIFDPHPFGYWVVFDDLSSPTTGLYIRRGRPGFNGPTEITLLEEEFTSPTSGGGFASSTLLFDLAEECYIVITTVSYPDGELRGEFEDITPPAVRESSWGRIRSLYR